MDSRAARRSADRPVANGAQHRQQRPGTSGLRAAHGRQLLVPRRGHEGQRRPTGHEASLPIGSSGPVYFRLGILAGPGAVAAGGAVWLGRVAMHRRMQRRIARMEQTRALERERDRIARDLHDDIGAGLTEIAMHSDWVRRDLAGANPPDTQRRIENVCRSAVDLVRSADEIVWAANPANDTIERFVNDLAQSSEQFLEAAGPRVRSDIPEQLPVGTLTGTHRHFLSLAVREALNNAVKHAQADLVRLAIQADATRMLISSSPITNS